MPLLTSNCDLDSDIDENVKRHEVDRFEAQYLFVRALLHRLVLWRSRWNGLGFGIRHIIRLGVVGGASNLRRGPYIDEHG